MPLLIALLLVDLPCRLVLAEGGLLLAQPRWRPVADDREALIRLGATPALAGRPGRFRARVGELASAGDGLASPLAGAMRRAIRIGAQARDREGGSETGSAGGPAAPPLATPAGDLARLSRCGPAITVATSCDFDQPVAVVWRGITNAEMSLPKPLCFNLGLPLPRSCAITATRDGVGTRRRCISDKGAIEQEITAFVPGRSLAFRLVSHDLATAFAIGAMDDRFAFSTTAQGAVRLTRTTRISIPLGCGYLLRRWAIARSLASIHRYVYRNIAAVDPG